jgi:hypothetical protein
MHACTLTPPTSATPPTPQMITGTNSHRFAHAHRYQMHQNQSNHTFQMSRIRATGCTSRSPTRRARFFECTYTDARTRVNFHIVLVVRVYCYRPVHAIYTSHPGIHRLAKRAFLLKLTLVLVFESGGTTGLPSYRPSYGRDAVCRCSANEGD